WRPQRRGFPGTNHSRCNSRARAEMKRQGVAPCLSWNGNACYFFGAAVSDFIAPVAGAAGAAGVAGAAAIAGAAGAAGVAGAAAIAGAAVSAFGFDVFAGGGGFASDEFADDDAFCIDFWLSAKFFSFAAFAAAFSSFVIVVFDFFVVLCFVV